MSCDNCKAVQQELDAQKKASTDNFLLLKERIINTDDLVRRYQAKLVESASRTQQIQELRKQNDILKLKCDSAEEQLSSFLRTNDEYEKSKAVYESRIENLHTKIAELEHQVGTERATIVVLQQQIQGKNELVRNASSYEAKMKDMFSKVRQMEGERDTATFEADDAKRSLKIANETLRKYEQILRDNGLLDQLPLIESALSAGSAISDHLSSIPVAVETSGKRRGKKGLAKADEAKQDSAAARKKRGASGKAKVSASQERPEIESQSLSLLGTYGDEDSADDTLAKESTVINAFISDTEESNDAPRLSGKAVNDESPAPSAAKRTRLVSSSSLVSIDLPSIEHEPLIPPTFEMLLSEVSDSNSFVDTSFHPLVTSSQLPEKSRPTSRTSAAPASDITFSAQPSSSSKMIYQAKSSVASSNFVQESPIRPLSSTVKKTADLSAAGLFGLSDSSDESDHEDRPASTAEKPADAEKQHIPNKAVPVALPKSLNTNTSIFNLVKSSALSSITPSEETKKLESLEKKQVEAKKDIETNRRPEPRHRSSAAGILRRRKPITSTPSDTASTSSRVTTENTETVPANLPVAESRDQPDTGVSYKPRTSLDTVLTAVFEVGATLAVNESAASVIAAEQIVVTKDVKTNDTVPTAVLESSIIVTQVPEKSSEMEISASDEAVKDVTTKKQQPSAEILPSTILISSVIESHVGASVESVKGVSSEERPQLETDLQSAAEASISENISAEEHQRLDTVLQSADEVSTSENFSAEERPQLETHLQSAAEASISQNVSAEERPQLETHLQSAAEASISENVSAEERPQLETDLQSAAEASISQNVSAEEQPQLETDLQSAAEASISQNVSAEERPQLETDLQSAGDASILENVSTDMETLAAKTVTASENVEVSIFGSVSTESSTAAEGLSTMDTSVAADFQSDQASTSHIPCENPTAIFSDDSDSESAFGSPRKLNIVEYSPSHEDEASRNVVIEEPSEIPTVSEASQPLEAEKDVGIEIPSADASNEALDDDSSLSGSPPPLAIVEEDEELGKGGEQETEPLPALENITSSMPDVGEHEEGEVSDEDEETDKPIEMDAPATSGPLSPTKSSLPDAHSILDMHSLGILSPVRESSRIIDSPSSPDQIAPPNTARIIDSPSSPDQIAPPNTARIIDSPSSPDQIAPPNMARRLSMEEIFASVELSPTILPPPSFQTEGERQQMGGEVFKRPQPVLPPSILSPTKKPAHKQPTAKPGTMSSAAGIVRTRGRTNLYSGSSK